MAALLRTTAMPCVRNQSHTKLFFSIHLRLICLWKATNIYLHRRIANTPKKESTSGSWHKYIYILYKYIDVYLILRHCACASLLAVSSKRKVFSSVFKLDQRYALSSRIRQLSHMYLNLKFTYLTILFFVLVQPSIYILILFTLSFFVPSLIALTLGQGRNGLS